MDAFSITHSQLPEPHNLGKKNSSSQEPYQCLPAKKKPGKLYTHEMLCIWNTYLESPAFATNNLFFMNNETTAVHPPLIICTRLSFFIRAS